MLRNSKLRTYFETQNQYQNLSAASEHIAASRNFHHYARANTELQRQMLNFTKASLDNLELFYVHHTTAHNATTRARASRLTITHLKPHSRLPITSD